MRRLSVSRMMALFLLGTLNGCVGDDPALGHSQSANEIPGPVLNFGAVCSSFEASWTLDVAAEELAQKANGTEANHLCDRGKGRLFELIKLKYYSVGLLARAKDQWFANATSTNYQLIQTSETYTRESVRVAFESVEPLAAQDDSLNPTPAVSYSYTIWYDHHFRYPALDRFGISYESNVLSACALEDLRLQANPFGFIYPHNEQSLLEAAKAAASACGGDGPVIDL